VCDDLAAAHERSAGAPEQEIEVTPAMIEAGYDVYCQMDTDVEVSRIPAREMIIKIFLAMQGTVR
jgi:hypothetical protein